MELVPTWFLLGTKNLTKSILGGLLGRLRSSLGRLEGQTARLGGQTGGPGSSKNHFLLARSDSIASRSCEELPEAASSSENRLSVGFGRLWGG